MCTAHVCKLLFAIVPRIIQYPVCNVQLCFSDINWCLGHDAGSRSQCTHKPSGPETLLLLVERTLLCWKCVSQRDTGNTGEGTTLPEETCCIAMFHKDSSALPDKVLCVTQGGMHAFTRQEILAELTALKKETKPFTVFHKSVHLLHNTGIVQ